MSLVLAFNIFYNISCCFYCWLWRPHCICLEQISIGKCPKYFKANSFRCCILNNTHLFWNQSRKSKKLHDQRKSGDVSKQNGSKSDDVSKQYFDTFYVLLAIIVTEYDVSSKEIFFLKSQKGVGIASVNNLKVKDDINYWDTIIPDRNQIHVLWNFLLLSR